MCAVADFLVPYQDDWADDEYRKNARTVPQTGDRETPETYFERRRQIADEQIQRLRQTGESIPRELQEELNAVVTALGRAYLINQAMNQIIAALGDLQNQEAMNRIATELGRPHDKSAGRKNIVDVIMMQLGILVGLHGGIHLPPIEVARLHTRLEHLICAD